MRSGTKLSHIQASLIQRGTPPEVVSAAVVLAGERLSIGKPRPGFGRLTAGLLVLLLGIGLTVGSYIAALSDDGGEGRYYVFYGAPIVGLIWTATGVQRMVAASRIAQDARAAAEKELARRPELATFAAEVEQKIGQAKIDRAKPERSPFDTHGRT